MCQYFLFSLVLFYLYKLLPAQDISPFADVSTLSELPMEKLLQVRKTFDIENIHVNKSSLAELPNNEPYALPLNGEKSKLNHRGGYHDYNVEIYTKKGDGDKKSIQSIFQVSVTALAFLAFGGYLLCLIIQAIRAKNMDAMNMTTATTILQAFNRPNRRRRTTTRRPIRGQRPYQTTRRRPRPRNKRDAWPETDPELMYRTLLDLSEVYSHYHTIDYRNVNKSYFNSHFDN